MRAMADIKYLYISAYIFCIHTHITSNNICPSGFHENKMISKWFFVVLIDLIGCAYLRILHLNGWLPGWNDQWVGVWVEFNSVCFGGFGSN